MDNDNYLQLELFHNKDKINQDTHLKGSFLSYIKNYEKFLLFTIALLIIGIVTYCLGVEQGKRIALLYVPVKPEVKSNFVQRPVVKPPQVIEDVTSKVVVVNQSEPEKSQVGVSSAEAKFTIQLGSYKFKTNAQKDIEELKSQGLLPVLLNRGKFSILCVGNFQNAETAKSLLTELRKKYKNCYIIRR